MTKSVLDDLGAEITGIVSPVTICMATTVLLVRLFNPEGKSNPATVYIASVYYDEDEHDSAGKKFAGSLINALIFVVLVAVMTFVLVLLFKYGYTKFIYGYMGFAGFSIFFILTGVIIAQLCHKIQFHLDLISFFFILYNFAVVGVLSVFFWPAPLTLKQGYLIVVGVVTAYVFTWIPEWTTWVLLIAMCLYDLWAVLTPGGPLKVLVELAMERDEDIPALVYEARPSGGRAPGGPGRWGKRTAAERHQSVPTQDPDDISGQLLEVVDTPPPSETVSAPPPRGTSGNAHGGAGPSSDFPSPVRSHGRQQQEEAGVGVGDGMEEEEEEEDPNAPLMGVSRHETQETHGTMSSHRGTHAGPENSTWPMAVPSPGPPPGTPPFRLEDDEDDEFGLPDAIKLGLGDFIFYSVLVGRAAMFDFLTVFASYLAIVAGLGMTLMLLALYHKALPALPISIALGCVFYFITRWILEPVVISMAVNLVFF